MLKYTIKRLLLLIPVLLGVSMIVFLVLRLFTPDPAATILGQHATQDAIQKLDIKLGFNLPLYTQYWRYLVGILHGDLGTSLMSSTAVTKELFNRFPATVELALSATIFSSVAGVLIGVVSAVRKNSLVDHASMVGALIGVSMPIFWLGILLIILFSSTLHWLPTFGRAATGMAPAKITGLYLIDSLITGNFAAFWDSFKHLILPTVALGLASTAIVARMTRSSMLESLGQDYIRTARAKGLSGTRVNYRHALRNALIPIVTVIGLQLGALLGGAVLTETVFAWGGIGSYIVKSIIASDYPVIQGAVLLIAFVFVLVNLLVDLLYALLDPRIKYS